MTEWEEKDKICVAVANACSICVLHCVFCGRSISSSWMEGSVVSFASEDRWQSRGHVTWFDGIVINQVYYFSSTLQARFHTVVAVVAWWKRTSWQRVEINDWWTVVQQGRKCLILASRLRTTRYHVSSWTVSSWTGLGIGLGLGLGSGLGLGLECRSRNWRSRKCHVTKPNRISQRLQDHLQSVLKRGSKTGVLMPKIRPYYTSTAWYALAAHPRTYCVPSGRSCVPLLQ